MYLRDWAAELAAQSSEVPVLVSRVCRLLGVEIKKSNAVPKHKAYLSIDPTQEPPAQIALPRKEIRDFERFCIAHEVGHYLLIVHFKLSPKNDDEYWDHERVCDEFARHLLIPERYLKGRLDRDIFDAQRYLLFCRNLHNLARIPWIHAGKRISEARNEVAFFRCQKDAHGISIVSSSTVRATSRPVSLRRQSKLYVIVNSLLTRANDLNRRVSAEITYADTDSSELRGLLPAGRFSAAAEAFPGRFPDVKISVVTG